MAGDLGDLLLAAANRGVGMGNDEPAMFHLTKNIVQVCGKTVLGELRPGDRPSVFLACEVDADGKAEPGAVCFLNDRLIICWMKGTFRGKVMSRTVAIADIGELSSSVRTGSRLTGDRKTFGFNTPQGPISLVLYSPKMKPPSVNLVEGMLLGAITFTFGDEEQVTPSAEPEPTA